MRKTETTKFEFLITLEGNIVCQRFFNVKNYNPDVRNSLEIYYVIADVIKEIQQNLKMKSIQYLYDNETKNSLVSEPEENFIIQIKLGEDIIISRIFSASIYPKKVRYTVDVRPEIRDILNKISEALSSEEVEKEYLGIAL